MNTDRVLCEARSTVERVEILALFYLAARGRAYYTAARRIFQYSADRTIFDPNFCAICILHLSRICCIIIIEREVRVMSMDKAIKYGKEHRKQYYGTKAIDKTCRNGGSCQYCQMNRKYKFLKKMQEPIDKLIFE